MRRTCSLWIIILLAGCEGPPTGQKGPAVGSDAPSLAAAQADPSQQPDPDAPVSLPSDLGTRPKGEDWPAFLGPRGDSTSNEKGIITEWNKTQPRIVWQCPLGTGYGTAVIARGRLFHFGAMASRPG